MKHPNVKLIVGFSLFLRRNLDATTKRSINEPLSLVSSFLFRLSPRDLQWISLIADSVPDIAYFVAFISSVFSKLLIYELRFRLEANLLKNHSDREDPCLRKKEKLRMILGGLSEQTSDLTKVGR